MDKIQHSIKWLNKSHSLKKSEPQHNSSGKNKSPPSRLKHFNPTADDFEYLQKMNPLIKSPAPSNPDEIDNPGAKDFI